MGNTLEEFAVEKIRELEVELKKADEIIESQQKQIDEFNDIKAIVRRSLYQEDSYCTKLDISMRWNTSKRDAERIAEYFCLESKDYFEGGDND